ncbi:branched-chain amino acid ABC transporter permease [Paracoccus sp. S-4012]|uniref:AzlC family ABC transporter permease n=1 Tax=Paracoccus sp. S-4012 TaxID=2665648 RepID=UPI0012B10B52|nr:AzlC family ABC transporter permease [Paracoccus sp. S-4012]MRX49749.1 branched-chain amino acid ABC transporter permease [Paracoccus sp. S-4012]
MAALFPSGPPLGDDAGSGAGRGVRRAFRQGLLASLPLAPVFLPFGLIFGVVSIQAGFDLAQVWGFSVLVLAGASQITAVQLIAEGAPAWLVLVSALAVNLRMAMYSASLVPWLGAAPLGARAGVAYALVDTTYALAVVHYEAEPGMMMAERLAFFAGLAVTLALPWPLVCGLGAALGQALPGGLGLDYAVPITFIAMTAPMLRSRAQIAAAVVAFGLALVLAGLPSGVGLLPAAILGMAVGAAIEARDERRRFGR